MILLTLCNVMDDFSPEVTLVSLWRNNKYGRNIAGQVSVQRSAGRIYTLRFYTRVTACRRQEGR